QDGLEEDGKGPKTQALLRTLVEKHVVLTATPVQGTKTASPAVLDLYDPSARERLSKTLARQGPAQDDSAEWAGYCRVLTGFVKAGGRLVLGSDSGSVSNVPGVADHQAVENLVRCGLTPIEAIRVATSNGATFLGIQDRTGSLQAGKEADLLVVRGNPAQ